MVADPAALQAVWQQLCAPYSSRQDLCQQLWIEIERAYTGKDRHYHNLQHLGQLLSLAHTHQASIEDPASLQFAIFYHDIVYKPLSSTNEEDSAVLARARLQELGLSPLQQQKVVQMILATKSHTAGTDTDTRLLLDFDLSILAASWQDYLTYTRQIREEYSLVPPLRYKSGRQQVLRHFLALPQIYKTALFKKHEVRARQNLEKELLLLEA